MGFISVGFIDILIDDKGSVFAKKAIFLVNYLSQLFMGSTSTEQEGFSFTVLSRRVLVSQYRAGGFCYTVQSKRVLVSQC